MTGYEVDRWTTCPNCGTPNRLRVRSNGDRDCASCDYQRDAPEQQGLDKFQNNTTTDASEGDTR